MHFRRISLSLFKSSAVAPLGHLRAIGRRSLQAMTLVEIATAVALLGLVAATASATLMTMNKNAVSTRMMSNAREIVQRNIEAAMGEPFSASNEPDILKVTTGSSVPVWVAWDDTGGTAPVNIYTSRDGTNINTGLLYRSVTKVTNPPFSADLRRITFKIDYSLFGRQLTYQVTTTRAMDK